MTVTVSSPASPTCNARLVERCTQEAETTGGGAGLGVLWRGPSVSMQRPRGSVTSCRTSSQFKRTRESGTKREGGRRNLSPCLFPPLPSLSLQTAWKPVIPMIPPGRALIWALWLILGAGAVKARVLGQSQGGADWAGGSEGDNGPAGIPNKVRPNIAKRDEAGLVGKTINLEESEDDELAAPAAAELLEDPVSLESGEQQERSLQEGQELDRDEQQKKGRGSDEDLAQEDDEDQNQELNEKEEQEQHSRDPGQAQGQNQGQGEMQELKEEGEQEQEREGGDQGWEEVREQRQGQGETEEAAGLDYELKQKEPQEQRQIQVQGQKLGQIPLHITVPAVEQRLARERPPMEQRQIPVRWEGQPQLPPQAKAREPVLVPVQAPTQGPAEEQASMGLRPGLRSNSSEFFPSPNVGTYEPQQPLSERGLSNLGQVPPPEMHLMMLAWGPWECHCPTGTMSRVRGGKFLDFTRRLQSGPLSRLQTQRQP